MLSRRLAACLTSALLPLLFWTDTTLGDASWGIQPVDSSGITQGHNGTSVALDPQGRPCIAYYEATQRDLRFSAKNLGYWTITPVDTTGDMGRWPSLAVDGQGNAHISYIYYLDPNDEPVGDLRYAKRTGSTWSIETVDATGIVGEYTSLVLDSQGNPHISYYDATNTSVKYAHKSGGSWSIETVESAGQLGIYTSLALDSQGAPRIAYQDATNSRVRYAAKSGSTWTLETVSGLIPVYATHIALALDSQNIPHIAYLDQLVNKTKYATKPSSTWNQSLATALGTDIRGAFIALAIDSQDVPHMSYYDTDRSDVMYAVKNGSGGIWLPQFVDDYGTWSSLVLDAGDHPHISYHTTPTTQVRYAVFTDNVSDTSQEGRVAFLSLEAFPNPVRTSTTLLLRSPQAIPLHLVVLDARGRVVRELANRSLPPGTHAFGWDGRDDMGAPVAAGVYFAVVRPDWLATSRKLVVVR